MATCAIPVDSAIIYSTGESLEGECVEFRLLYEGPLNFQVFRETLANQLSVVLMGWQYAALAVRYPSSVCLVGPFNAPTTPGS